MAGTGIGAELRLERERRGLSIEGLCASTKVNARHVEAVERGDIEALPGGVFRRGILRAYLGAVGLDERSWMERVEASYPRGFGSSEQGTEAQKEAWATFAKNVKNSRSLARPRDTPRWLGVVAMFVVLLAAAWAVWRYILQKRLGG